MIILELLTVCCIECNKACVNHPVWIPTYPLLIWPLCQICPMSFAYTVIRRHCFRPFWSRGEDRDSHWCMHFPPICVPSFSRLSLYYCLFRNTNIHQYIVCMVFVALTLLNRYSSSYFGAYLKPYSLFCHEIHMYSYVAWAWHFLQLTLESQLS